MLLTCVLGSSEILSDIEPPLRFIRRQVTAVLLVRNYSYSKFVIKYFNSGESFFSQLFGKPVKPHRAGEHHHVCHAGGEACLPAGVLRTENSMMVALWESLKCRRWRS